MDENIHNMWAFPSSVDKGDYINYNLGMTLRDYFAIRSLYTVYMQNRSGYGDEVEFSLFAEKSYKMADAMLKARVK